MFSAPQDWRLTCRDAVSCIAKYEPDFALAVQAGFRRRASSSRPPGPNRSARPAAGRVRPGRQAVLPVARGRTFVCVFLGC